MSPTAVSSIADAASGVAPANDLTKVKTSVIALIPALRGFARSITRDAGEADDLLQETLLRALANIHQFTPGTNLKAWLFTILRNTHISTGKKRARERNASSSVAAEDIGAAPPQKWLAATDAMKAALAELPDDQREVVVLIGGLGLSYEECAEVCGCAMGTVKSRLNRARVRLALILDAETVDDMA